MSDRTLDITAVADLAGRLADLAVPVHGTPAADAILGTARILEALVRVAQDPEHAAEHAEDAAARTGTLMRDACAVWAAHATGPAVDTIDARLTLATGVGDPVAKDFTITIPEDIDAGGVGDGDGFPIGEATVHLSTGTISSGDGRHLTALPARDALAVHIATHTAAAAATDHLYGPAR